MSLDFDTTASNNGELVTLCLPESLYEFKAAILDRLGLNSEAGKICLYPARVSDAVVWLGSESFDTNAVTLFLIDAELATESIIKLAGTARARSTHIYTVVVPTANNGTPDVNALKYGDVDEIISFGDGRALAELTSDYVNEKIDQNAAFPSESIDWKLFASAVTSGFDTTIVVKSLDHRFLFINKAFEDHTGLSRNSILGKNDLKIGTPSNVVLGDSCTNNVGLWKLDNEAVRSGEPTLVRESRVEPSTGEIRKMLTLRTPIKDKSGECNQLLVQSNDITLQVKLEQDLQSLNYITRDMINNRNLNVVFKSIVDGLLQVTEAHYCYISRVSALGDCLETVACAGPSEHLCLIKHRLGEGVAGQAWKKKRTVISRNYQSDQIRVKSITSLKQACAMPILHNDKVECVLGLAYKREWPSIDTEFSVMDKYAQLTTMALENSMLQEKNTREFNRTAVVTNIGRKLNSANDLALLLDRACRSCIKAFDASKAQIVELTSCDVFQSKSEWELLDEQIVKAQNEVGDDNNAPIFKQCVDQKELLLITEHGTGMRNKDVMPGNSHEPNFGAAVVVPLISEDRVWGVLAIYRNESAGNFSDHDINLFKHLGEQISDGIHRCELIEAVQHRANHDVLTGLPNRSCFESLLTEKIALSKETSSSFALLFIDLDGFKAINDTLGHAVGDKFLIEIANRFRKYFKNASGLARIGGDEFGVIIDEDPQNENNEESLRRVLEQSVELIKHDVVIGESNMSVGASIGISRFPDDGADSLALLQQADIAMYSVKGRSNGGYRFYDNELGSRYANRVQLESQLALAVKNAELRLYYQPKINCKTGFVSGVEALIRWQHPQRGLLTPYHFIEVAEESGIIVDIGNWVIDEAIRQLCEWQKMGRPIEMAVNIAAPQLADVDFAATLLKKLDSSVLSNSLLQLEVTESVVMNDIKSVVSQLQTLKECGLKIALDDFGTGYSSLKYLKELPLNILKIDKSFIDNLTVDAKDRSIANMIVSIAKTLDLSTVAEGVETEDQKAVVQQLGCDSIQGYLYSAPVSAEKILDVIDKLNSHSAFGVAQLRRAS